MIAWLRRQLEGLYMVAKECERVAGMLGDVEVFLGQFQWKGVA